ncbi:nondiscriminating aspartyl-tRNA synthetase [Clostridium pascui]|uniref:aspartate--tRNA(Asn) ligase n=1 Tax=Clostridium pascui TaxID=46609 RepID=UPI00195D898C|nr:aspartate--tRNA(Asn) ligase [Clostridium pascui]MBM7871006.1 nondiscriminating aspartyl-tRNA synthetase [Clostridium pascui]
MKRVLVEQLKNHIDEEVLIKGWVARIRKLKSVTFLIIRDRTGLVQCIATNEFMEARSIKLETVVSIIGSVVEGNNSYNPFEVQIKSMEILSQVTEELPIEINKKDLEVNLDVMLNNRVLSLRHEKKNAIFKVQNIIVEAFREFLKGEGFTEIFTPKIVAEGAEGGSEVFLVKYFEENAYLAQSPQFYKQMMVGAGFERVFEIGHAYRAEEHNTNRHLNEYVSMDLEMGFIDGFEDIMDIEEKFIKHMLLSLDERGAKYIELLGASLPVIENKIPKIKFNDAINILNTMYKKTLSGDLDPEGERLICSYVKEKYNSDFVFITHYPREKRPMYTMPSGEEETKSFDLLFRGIEITTGGQRIHDYNMLINNMLYKGLNPNNYEYYLNTFKYGIPPHGGLAIGLERLTAMILGLSNVRETSLFPRDRTRLQP